MISIIISAHNEERNIGKVLSDIVKELKLIDEKSELIVCLSGCTDNTGKIAEEKLGESKIKYRILKTPKGKIKSQKNILKKINKSSEYILFIDCDVRLKRNAIKNMLNDAKMYNSVKLFYSTELPIKRKSIFYKIINVRTLNPEYVIAKENVKNFHPFSKNKKKKVFATGGMYLIRKRIYDVDGKTIGDDSYLTHSVYHRFGPGTIKQTENSIIFYQPVYTFTSWINKWKRIWGDIDSLYRFHPEFKYLEKYMKLKIDFPRLIKEMKIKLVIYFFLERSWNQIGGFIFRKFSYKSKNDWKQLKETKEINLK